MIELVMGAAAVGLLIAAAWIHVEYEDRRRRLDEIMDVTTNAMMLKSGQLNDYAEKLTDWEGRLGVYAVQLGAMYDLLERRVADDPRYKIFWEDIERGKQGAEEKKPG